MRRPAPPPMQGNRTNPAFTEWMMGLPRGHVTTAGISVQAQLKVLGNGVVPQQAALAVHRLARQSY